MPKTGGGTESFKAISVSETINTGGTTIFRSGDQNTKCIDLIKLPESANTLSTKVISLEDDARETVFTKSRDDIPLSNLTFPPTLTNIYNAMSADGNTVAVYYSLVNGGVNNIIVNVYTFNQSAGWAPINAVNQWTKKGPGANSITFTNNTTTMALKGQSVSLSHDGDQIAIGSTDTATGSRVIVYSWNGTGWAQKGVIITISWWDLSTIDYKWCEMSGDGNNVFMYNGALGEAEIHTYSGTAWSQTADLSGNVGTYSGTTGASVFINYGGNYTGINTGSQSTIQFKKYQSKWYSINTAPLANTIDTDIIRIDKNGTTILLSRSGVGTTFVYRRDVNTDAFYQLGSISPTNLSDINISHDGNVISWFETSGSVGSYLFTFNAVKLNTINGTWSNVSDNTITITSKPYLQTQNVTNISLSEKGQRLIIGDKVYTKTEFDVIGANTNYISPNLVLESNLWFDTAWMGKRIDIDASNITKPHVSPYGVSLIPIAWLPRNQVYPNHDYNSKPLLSSAKSYFTIKLAQRSPQVETNPVGTGGVNPIDWAKSTKTTYTQGNSYTGMGAGAGLIPEQTIHFIAGYTDADLEPSTNDGAWRDPKPYIKVIGSTVKHLKHLTGKEGDSLASILGGTTTGHYYYPNDPANTKNPKIGGIKRIVIAEGVSNTNLGTPPVCDRVWLLLEQDWNYYPYQQSAIPPFNNHLILQQILEKTVIDVRMYKNEEMGTETTTTPDARSVHEQSISWNLLTVAEAEELLSSADSKLILRESTMRPQDALVAWPNSSSIPTPPAYDLIIGKQEVTTGSPLWSIKSEPYQWYVNLFKHEYPTGVTSGNEIIGGELDVSGAARFWGNVDISGVLEVKNLIVHKESTIYDIDDEGAEFTGNITVNGNIIGNKELILAEHITTQGTQLLREYEYPLTGGQPFHHWIRLAQYEGGSSGTERSVCEGLFEVNYQADVTAVKHVTRFVAGGCVDNNGNSGSNLEIYKKDLYINVIDNTGWRSSSLTNNLPSDNAYIQGLHIDTDGQKMFVYAKVWKGDTTSKVGIRLWQNAHSETYTANTCWTVGSTITITTDKTTLPSANWNNAISHYTTIDLEITDTAGTTSGGGLRDVTIGASAPLDALPFYYKSTGFLSPTNWTNDDVLSNGMMTFTQPVNCHNTVRMNRNLDMGNTKAVRSRALLGPNQKYLHHNKQTSGQVSATNFDVPPGALTGSTNDLFIENVGSSAANIRMNVPSQGSILLRALSTFNTDALGGLFWSNPIEFKTHQTGIGDVASFDAYFNHTNSIYDAKDVSGMNLILGTTVNSTTLPAVNGTLQVRDISGNNLLNVNSAAVDSSGCGKITMQGWEWTSQTNPVNSAGIGGKAVSDRIIFDLNAGTKQHLAQIASSGKVLTTRGAIHIQPVRVSVGNPNDSQCGWGASLYCGNYGTSPAGGIDDKATRMTATVDGNRPGSGNVYCNSVRQNLIFQAPSLSIGGVGTGFSALQGYQGGINNRMYYNGGDVRHVVVSTKNCSYFGIVKLPSIQEPMVGMQITVTRHNTAVGYNSVSNGVEQYKKPIQIQAATLDYVNAPPSIWCGITGTQGAIVIDPYNQLSQPNGATTIAHLWSCLVPVGFKGNEITSVTLLAMAGSGDTSKNEFPAEDVNQTGANKYLKAKIDMGDTTPTRYFWQVVGTSGTSIL